MLFDVCLHWIYFLIHSYYSIMTWLYIFLVFFKSFFYRHFNLFNIWVYNTKLSFLRRLNFIILNLICYCFELVNARSFNLCFQLFYLFFKLFHYQIHFFDIITKNLFVYFLWRINFSVKRRFNPFIFLNIFTFNQISDLFLVLTYLISYIH